MAKNGRLGSVLARGNAGEVEEATASSMGASRWRFGAAEEVHDDEGWQPNSGEQSPWRWCGRERGKESATMPTTTRSFGGGRR